MIELLEIKNPIQYNWNNPIDSMISCHHFSVILFLFFSRWVRKIICLISTNHKCMFLHFKCSFSIGERLFLCVHWLVKQCQMNNGILYASFAKTKTRGKWYAIWNFSLIKKYHFFLLFRNICIVTCFIFRHFFYYKILKKNFLS